ncbi:MAG: DUF11 domain-containing protein [Anaerolineae bacterium]|nr:DUF11 domain-containing protein [Anaerolineae bacterium]
MLRPTRSSEPSMPEVNSFPALLIFRINLPAILLRVPNALTRLLVALVSSTLALICIIILFAGSVSDTVAAPNPRPMTEILTGTTSIAHTNNTTHEMRILANGQLSNRFLNNDGRNQIDQDGADPTATTIAIVFDQHGATTPAVDVGVQGDFLQTTPITLNTSSNFPNYIEDTRVVYASQTLPYQIIQRTLAPTDSNCVIMELDIQNTGGSNLTGGKLLYMMDIDVALNATGDLGFFDPDRNLVYLTDYNVSGVGGYAMGISLVEGSIRGHGVNGNSFPSTDAQIINELISPSNVITDGSNDVAWLIANIPTLTAGQVTQLTFSICASTGLTEEEAGESLNNTFKKIINLSAIKSAVPASGEPILPGQPVTYTITLANIGNFPIKNLTLTDTLPLSTSLLAYNISQGSITANSGVINASLDQLDPASQTVTITLSLATSALLQPGTVLTNQATIKSDQIVTTTNIVTHLVGRPVLTLTKQASSPAVRGGLVTYTISITNTGEFTASNVVVTDSLPSGANYQSGGNLIGNDVRWTIPVVSPNNGSETVSFVVTSCQQSLVNQAYRVTGSTEGVDSALGPPVSTSLISPTITVDFVHAPTNPTVGETVFFNDSTTTNGGPPVSWSWDFGDGTTGAGSSPNHSYTLPGEYTVALTVTDSCGFTATGTDMLTISGPVLSVIKTAAPEPVHAGDVLSYTIVIFNSGSDEATGVTINDPLPGNTQFIPGSVLITPPSAGGTTGSPPIIADDLTIAAGTSVTVTYRVRVGSQTPNGTIITNTASVTGTKVYTPATDTVTSTVFLPAPAIAIVKSGPTVAQVGSSIVFTFTVSNIGNTPLNNVVVEDNLVSPVSLVSKGNGDAVLDQAEIWIYSASYNIPLTSPATITNTAFVTATYLSTTVTDSDTHVTSVTGFDPVLSLIKSGPATASVGQTVVFSFTVSHAPTSDRTPIHNITVIDNFAGSATRISGDDGDDLLEDGESWLYTVPYTIKPNTPNPLINIGLVSGKDTEGATIVATDTHQTDLSNFNPVLFVAKDGPAAARIGQTTIYTITVLNFVKMNQLTALDINIDLTLLATIEPGDGAPISITSIFDDVAGTPLLIRGDTNLNGKLDGGEAWIYRASHVIAESDQDPLINTVTVNGRDPEDDLLSKATSHSTDLIQSNSLFQTYFFPLVEKNFNTK